MFDWKRRMGVHEAYHQNAANRWIHWLCIPIELWSVVALLSCVPLPMGLDLGLAIVVLVAPIYVLTEPLLGALMVAFLLACWWSASSLAGAPLAVGAVLAFAVTFSVQVGLGHRIEGRDDTQQNLAELGRTTNPIPVLLVFYYHLVEIALAAGYRPALRTEIADHTATELARIASHSSK